MMQDLKELTTTTPFWGEGEAFPGLATLIGWAGRHGTQHYGLIVTLTQGTRTKGEGSVQYWLVQGGQPY
jgi:hypothetical protein